MWALPEFDPGSLILTNVAVSLALTAVLLVSRTGLGADARGVRTWVLGDLLLAGARVELAALMAGAGLSAPASFPLLPGALACAGMVLHYRALGRASGDAPAHWRTLVEAASAALIFTAITWPMGSLSHRVRVLDAAFLVAALATLHILRPLLTSWGARLMAAVMLLAAVAQTLRFSAVLLGVGTELAPDAITHLKTAVRPGSMVVDLLVSLFLTAGFLLLLQERLRERIQKLVVTDALTGVLNRHGLWPRLEQALSSARRHERPISVLMLDLDHFKRVNDVHGHGVGDAVLSGFCARVRAGLRDADVLGRTGGEEFLVLLPDTLLAAAAGLADRLRLAVAASPVTPGAPVVTFSGGVACSDEVQGNALGLAQLLALADQRLYAAKTRRNCIVAQAQVDTLAST